MSEVSDKTPAVAEKKQPISRARKWRQRIIYLLLVLIVIAILARLSISILLPPVLRKVASGFGLTAHYERLELYAVDGDVGLWNLEFKPLSGGEPVIKAAYCRGSISLLGLLRGKLNVRRAEAEDAYVLLERTADGKIPLLEQFLTQPSSTTPPPTSTNAKPSAISLDPPLKIDVLRLQNASARLRDLTKKPATDVSLELDMLVTDVGSAHLPTKVALSLKSPEALVALYVNATGTSRNNQIDADLNVSMYGLDLRPAAAYLAPVGIVPVSSNISAQAVGKLQVRAPQSSTTQPSSNKLAATLTFSGMKLTADSVAVASVDEVKVDVPSITADAIDVKQIAVNGVIANASRTKSGRLAFSGIELGPTTAPSASASARHQKTATPTTSGGTVVSVDDFSVNGVSLTFDDALAATRLQLLVPGLKVEHLSTDPKTADKPATISLKASSPGLIKDISVSGTTGIAGAKKTFNLTVAANGISPEAAKPYLAKAGLSSTIESGSFTSKVSGQLETRADGSLATALNITDVRFADGDHELFTLPKVAVDDATVSADASHIRLGSIAVEGPVLPVNRDANGKLSVLGIGLAESKTPQPNEVPPPTTTTAAVTATQPSDTMSFPSIEIAKFVWTGAAVTLNDAGKEPLNLAVKDVNVEVTDLLLDPKVSAGKSGKIRVAMKAPGVVETVSIDGTVTPTGKSLAFDFTGSARGITAAQLKPVLAAFNVEPTLTQGSLKFGMAGSVAQTNGTLSADLTARDAQFVDGKQQWLSLGGASVRGASFDGKVVSVDSIQVDKASAFVSRDADGLVSVAGIKMLPVKSTTAAIATAKTSEPSPTRVDLTLPVVARVKAFKLNDAAISVQDDAVLPATKLALNAGVTANNISVGEDAESTPFTVSLSSPGVIDSLKVDGSFKFAPKVQQIDLTAVGKGINGQTIEPYLPPNIAISMKNGEFAAKLSAKLEPNKDGGSKAYLAVTDASLSDGVATGSIGALKSLRVAVDRIDLPGKVIAFDEVSTDGAQLAVTQNERGLSLLGVTITPEPQRPVRPTKESAAPGASGRASNVNVLLAQANEKPPLVTLKKLSLSAERLSFTSSQIDQPVVAQGSLTNKSPIELLGDDPTKRPAIDLELRATVEKIVDSIAVSTSLAPLAAEPYAKANVEVSGIHANELTAVLPQTKDLLDGKDLSDGKFTTSADAQFKFTRRGPTGIDFTRDFGADVTIHQTRLVQTGVERPVAGVDEIRADSIRYSPSSGALVVKAIDIVKPSASVLRDDAGIHALGFTLKTATTQPAATQPANAESTVTATAPSPKPAGQANAEPAKSTEPGPEMRVDRLTVSGVDFLIEDRVGKTPTTIPVNTLDVDVKGLSTRALVEPKPIRFSAIVGAGKVLLPSPREKTDPPTERPVFAEGSATGDLVLVPKPQGYIKMSLSGLELAAIRGLAEQAGITLERGTFDVRTDVRMEGADTFDARVYPTFNELRVSEPPNGPIQRIFQLPMPLDAAVGTLEQADGSITFPVSVPLKSGELNTGAVVGSAISSVGKVLAEATLAAPLKMAKLGAGLLGADTSSERTKGIPPVTVSFAPGETQLTAAEQSIVDSVVKRMKDDNTLGVTIQHTLGSDDVKLAEQRSNPLTGDSMALVSRLRQRQSELQQEQAESAAKLRVALASQERGDADAHLAELRATSVELKQTNDALDQQLELLAPGADRQADRRTKIAAILIGQMRLQAVQAVLLNPTAKIDPQRVRAGNVQFNPDTGDEPGTVTLTLIRAAKK